MGKYLNFFYKYLSVALEKHGSVSEIVRKTGLSRTAIDSWLRRETSPTLESLEKIADAIGKKPWELIYPEGELPTSPPQSPTVAALSKIIDEQEKRIRELESPSRALVKDKAVITNPDRDWIRNLSDTATDTEIRIFRQNLEAALKVIRKKSDDNSGAAGA